MNDETTTGQRIDRWLFHARFYKTRVLATGAVAAGHVKVNGERVRAGHRLKVGDRISLVRDQLPWAFVVASMPSRRGPASEARTCYVEDDATAEQRHLLRDRLRVDRQQMPRTDGRPDKYTRRKLRERHRQG